MLTLAEPECGILGCAMLSGVTAGLFSNLHEAVAKLVRYDREILPNPEWVDRYQRMQALFNDLYESSEQFWDRFDQL
jgi:xylulokinase